MMVLMMHGHMRMLRPRDLDKDYKPPPGLIKRVIRFARPYRFRLLGLLVLLAISSVLDVYLPPVITRLILDEALANGDVRLLTTLALFFIGLAFMQGIFQLITRLFSSRIGEGIIYDLRVALFDHIQRMPIAFFTRAQTGSLISRLNSDVVGAQRAVTETAAGVVTIVLSISVALIGMFGLEWRLTLMAIALVPIFVAPTRTMGRKLQKLIKRQMENNAAMSSQMTERFQVGGALLVKLFGRPKDELDEFGDRAGAVRDLGVKTALYGRAFFVAFSLVAAVGVGLSYLVGGRFVIDQSNAFKIGSLIAFTQYLMRLYTPVTMLSNVRVEIMTAMVAFERVFEILDFEPGITEKPGAVDLVDPDGHVVFDSVGFTYPRASEVSIESLEKEGTQQRDRDGNFALREISFEIPPGNMVALVGPSGAGKSTISMLLPRLYEVTDGSVKIDGHDVRDLTRDSLAAAIGKVTQDAHMFHDSIRSNLSYAKPDATETEMIEAAKAAQIHDLISSLPDGYDTVAGERGYRLSGGEKQRLAIARLLLKDPAIMILDEATAHLDSESERLIQAALAEALSGRSSLVIAHRLSTIMNANEILVLKDGEITERGTHFDLLSQGGLYEELYRTQFLQPEQAADSPPPGLERAAVTEQRVRFQREDS